MTEKELQQHVKKHLADPVRHPMLLPNEFCFKKTECPIMLRGQRIGSIDYVANFFDDTLAIEAKGPHGFSSFWSASKVLTYCTVYNNIHRRYSLMEPAILLPEETINDDIVYFGNLSHVYVFSYYWNDDAGLPAIRFHKYHNGIQIGAPV